MSNFKNVLGNTKVVIVEQYPWLSLEKKLDTN